MRKGDRVAIYMDSEHCLEWIVAYAAVHKAGAVMVPVNTRLALDEVETILRHAEPSASSPTTGSLARCRHASPSDRRRRHGRARLDRRRRVQSRARSKWRSTLDDIADIMYTSGTTGLPKGVLVRHRNVAMMPNCVPHWSGAGWLHGAPLFTFAGMSFIYNPMKLGLAGLYMPKFDVDHWFDVIERDRPTMIFMVPAMAELVTASPRFEASDLSSPFAVSIGSAPLAPATLQRMQDRMPQAAVANSYGLTEAGPAYIVMPREDLARKPGSVGKAMPPMEVKVVDADTETEMAAGEVGELLVRLPGKRREYYQRRRRDGGDVDE